MKNNTRGGRDQSGAGKNDQLQIIEPAKRHTSKEVCVSAIVFSLGEDRSVLKTLDTLFGQTFTDLEAIVVRQNPDKKGAASISRRWPQANIMYSEPGIGFCRACNSAANKASGRYLLFLDTTTWLNKTALAKLVEALESEPNAGVAGPLILNPGGTLRSIGMNINRLGQPHANLKPFEADTELIDNVFFVPGSALLIEKQLFNSLNGFDELYFRGMEDADLCWRARLLGKNIVVNPWSIAYSELDGGLIANSYLRHRNSLRMIIKNYGALKAFSGAASFTKETMVKSFRSLFSSKPAVFYQYWRALLWNLAMLPNSMRQRRLVQRKRRLNDKFILKHVQIEDDNEDITSDRAA